MIFLTGVSGYVGRRVARLLTASGLRVRGLVPAGEALPDGLPGVDLVRGDILDPASLEPHGDGVTAVVHAAAAMLPNSAETIRTVNVEGTWHVVAAARRWGAGRIVYVSAVSAAYAKRNSYGQSKIEAEEHVARSGVPWVALRPTMVYGEGGGLHFARLADLVKNAPGVFPVFGPGTAKLQPVHVEDVARAIRIALTRDEALGGTWGVSGATVVTFNGLVQRLAAALGVRRTLVHVPLPLAMAAASLAVRISPSFFLTPEALLGLNQDADLDYRPFAEACGYAPRTLDEGLDGALGVSEAQAERPAA
jgi:nucleoside-diphosphate-sugar epimerase